MISSIIVILVTAFISYVFANYVCVPMIKLSLYLVKTIGVYRRYLTLPSGHKWDRKDFYSLPGEVICTKCEYSVVEGFPSSPNDWLSSETLSNIHPTCSGYLMNRVLK